MNEELTKNNNEFTHSDAILWLQLTSKLLTALDDDRLDKLIAVLNDFNELALSDEDSDEDFNSKLDSLANSLCDTFLETLVNWDNE